MNTGNRIPATVLTGFLGSGKTTVLNRLLRDPSFSDAAVLINEFGEIGIDHDLVTYSDERTVVLAGGCVCCSIREDLEGAIRELFEQRGKGGVPRFSRLFIETTGLADPVPVLLTLKESAVAAANIESVTMMGVVDGVLGSKALARFAEAAKQVAVADAILVTKSDLAHPPALEALERELRRLNPLAEIARTDAHRDDVGTVVTTLCSSRSMAEKPDPAQHFLSVHGGLHGELEQSGGPALPHIRSFSVIYDQAVDWTAFGVWLTLLLHRHGENVLRVKGILNVNGLAAPVAIHGVQHMVYPPVHLDAWPSADHRSRLIFIVKDLDQTLVERSLHAFNGATATAARRGMRRSLQKAAGAGGTVGGRPIRRATAPSWIKG